MGSPKYHNKKHNLKNVLKLCAWATAKMYTPTAVEVALCNAGEPNRCKASIAFPFAEGSEPETKA